MCNIEALNIDFKGLTAEITNFQYVLDNAYFEAIEAPEVHKGNLKCNLTVRNAGSFYELNFHTEGEIQIPCDRCLDDMSLNICTDNKLVVKLGEEYSEEDDLVTIVEDEGTLDVSWFIYEFIALNIPIKHVHEPGKCNAEMLKLLEEHAVSRNDSIDEDDKIDPRWAKLSELKNKN